MNGQAMPPQGRIITYVDRSMYVEGQGYRPVFVVEGEEGYRENGTWPYTGSPGETLPWFWGHDLTMAQVACQDHNLKMGVTAQEAAIIVGRSMFPKAQA